MCYYSQELHCLAFGFLASQWGRCFSMVEKEACISNQVVIQGASPVQNPHPQSLSQNLHIIFLLALAKQTLTARACCFNHGSISVWQVLSFSFCGCDHHGPGKPSNLPMFAQPVCQNESLSFQSKFNIKINKLFFLEQYKVHSKIEEKVQSVPIHSLSPATHNHPTPQWPSDTS